MSAKPTLPTPHIPPSRIIQRARSGVHGFGVFARVAIPADYVIIEFKGERITKVESNRREAARKERVRKGGDGSSYVFELNKRYDLDARRYGNVSRYINHSCDPNCRAELRRGRIWIIATCDISEGDELAFDYGCPFRDWAESPCRCGSPKCEGYIVAENQRWRLRRMRQRSRAQSSG